MLTMPLKAFFGWERCVSIACFFRDGSRDMDDKRHTKRQRVLKAGTISFQGSGIDCAVRNMSIGGANLEVESHNGIPDSFYLLTGAENGKHHCHVVWRKEKRIGVVFN